MRGGRIPTTISKNFTTPAVGHARPSSSWPPISLPPSNSPTREYRAHHAVELPQVDAERFHPAWRSKSRLVGLAESGKIDRIALEAGVAWRAWHEAIGRLRVQSWEIRTGHSATSGTVAPIQATAAERLRAADAAIGPERVRLLEDSIVNDLPWVEIAKKLGMSDKGAVLRVVEALEALALWWRGLPVPDPPAVRFRNQPRSW